MSDSMQLFELVKQTVSARVSGVAPSMVDFEMRWVLDEFLKLSRVFEREIDVALTNGVSTYSLDIEDYESVVVLMSGTYNKSPLRQGRVPSGYTESGTPRMIGLVDDRTLRVYPIPADATGHPLKITVSLTLLPSIAAPIPDVVRPHHRVLVDGMLGSLYAMPDRPWTNLKLAVMHADQFYKRAIDVRREADRGRSFGAEFLRPSYHAL